MAAVSDKRVTPRPKVVLYADDSMLCRRVVEAVLARGPWEVLTARDGQEAVEKADERRPDLVILDGFMPRLTGLEALRVLRSREATRDVPILILTAEEGGEPAEAAECTGWLRKPIDPADLMDRVRSFLET
jgi:CheY-like chemotaxis protein